MKRVNRGSEPPKLKSIRKKYTPKWIHFYTNRNGKRLTYKHWRDFIEDLKTPFGEICGYCEESCRGEVDHFQPISKFPKLVYEWENWIFSCHNCNNLKWNKWPSFGYVNPCSLKVAHRPEIYFKFDLVTGEILARNGLKPTQIKKAKNMISDLHLNEIFHLRKRIIWIGIMGLLVNHWKKFPDNKLEIEGHMRELCSDGAELISLSRAVLYDSGITLD